MNQDTVEVRLHGRGGQGTVTLAALLVDAAFRDGWYALGFPAFGTERTGAPVAAFVRLARAPILDRSEVRHPSVIVVQDPTLLHALDVTTGATPDATFVLNATAPPDEFPSSTAVVPASQIAVRALGKPITSTAMLGAFAAATGLISIDAVAAAITQRFPGEMGARNVSAAREAFDALRGHEAVA